MAIRIRKTHRRTECKSGHASACVTSAFCHMLHFVSRTLEAACDLAKQTPLWIKVRSWTFCLASGRAICFKCLLLVLRPLCYQDADGSGEFEAQLQVANKVNQVCDEGIEEANALLSDSRLASGSQRLRAKQNEKQVTKKVTARLRVIEEMLVDCAAIDVSAVVDRLRRKVPGTHKAS